jgi:predicted site-specific integrase-resolvase
MNKTEYATGASIKTTYGVSTATLHRWEKTGCVKTVRTPGGHRLYSTTDVSALFSNEHPVAKKKKVCYARVSSEKQRPDLERQINNLKEARPDYELLSDVGSRINFKRRNFQRLLEWIYDGDVEEVVVTRKDRLCRFGFDLLDFFFAKTGTKLVVLYTSSETESDEQELADDLLAITTFFVARNNGLCSAQNRKRRKETATREQEEEKRTRNVEEGEDECER